MITGSNTNVRHRGRLFHVQTEDSGRRNPHVISHLYSAGTILASEKTDYSDRLDLASETLAKDVRALIEEQHKNMLTRLQRGDYDAVIGERIGGGNPANSGTEPAAPSVPLSTPRSSAAPPTPVGPPATDSTDTPRTFGDGVALQKPLDELILEYLVEKSRAGGSDRERPPVDRPRKKE